MGIDTLKISNAFYTKSFVSYKKCIAFLQEIRFSGVKAGCVVGSSLEPPCHRHYMPSFSKL